MPFNYLGDLYKDEIVANLRKKGFDIKNVHELNLILEEMGILKKSGKDWVTTNAGIKYSIYVSNSFNCNAWHPEIVDEIAKYLIERT